MTETEWLSGGNVNGMLCFLDERNRASPRQFRLYACACARRGWHWLADDRSRRAIEVAERFADGRATVPELEAAGEAARAVVARVQTEATPVNGSVLAAVRAAAATTFRVTVAFNARRLAQASSLAAAIDASYYLAQAMVHADPETEDGLGEYKQQAALLREIVANPLRSDGGQTRSKSGTLRRFVADWLRRPTPLDRWRRRNAAVVQTARDIYAERRFAALPILATALEQAGCPDEEIAAHCRAPGQHTRGCWAVDLLLGNE
jgi:hypothetical protein